MIRGAMRLPTSLPKCFGKRGVNRGTLSLALGRTPSTFGGFRLADDSEHEKLKRWTRPRKTAGFLSRVPGE